MASNAPRREGEPLEEVRERKGIKKGLYLLPSAFTAANIGMGYFAVMAALRGFQLLGMVRRVWRNPRVLKALDAIDARMLRAVPALGNWCRYVVIILRAG